MKRKEHLFVLMLVVHLTTAGTALAEFDGSDQDDLIALNHLEG